MAGLPEEIVGDLSLDVVDNWKIVGEWDEFWKKHKAA
jgi:hypothetical protein